MKADLVPLCEAARTLVEHGLVLARGGNVSMRDGDTVYITPRGAALDSLTPETFVPVNVRTGKSLGVEPPSTELPMHLACYRGRKDAKVVIHCHPAHAIAMSTLGIELPAITPEFLVYMGVTRLPTIAYMTPGTSTLAAAVSRRIREAPVVLLGNHGVIAVGENVERALTRVLLAEENARIYLLARAAGTPRVLGQEEWAQLQKARYGWPE